jgi:Patatin-like phospholipase
MPDPAGAPPPDDERADQAESPDAWAQPPTLLFALLALAVVLGVLLGWVRDVAAVKELDLSVAGTADAARHIVEGLSPTVERGVRGVLRENLVLVAAYVVAVSLAILWGRCAIKADRIRRGASSGVAAVAAGGALDLVKVLAVAAMLGRHYGPWPLISTSAAWTRWFLVFPAAAFAVYAVFVRVQRDVHRRIALPTKVGFLSQSLGTDRPADASEPATHAEWEPRHGTRRVGIACSGGGIRSAAYNLGALQALHEADIFRHADYVSAVSGGAYIAAAHAIVHKDAGRPGGFGQKFDFAPGSPEERYLRSHTMYLADSMRAKARFAARLFLGAALNVAFFYLLLFAVSRPLAWFLTYQRVHPELRDRVVSIPGYVWFVALWPAALGLLLGWFAILKRFKNDATYLRVVHTAVALVVLSAAMFGTVIALPWLIVYVPKAATAFLRWLPQVHVSTQGDTRNYLWLLQLLGAGAVFAAVRRLIRKNASKLALVVAGFVVPVSIALTLTLLVGDAAARGFHGRMTIFGVYVGQQWIWWIGVTVLLVVFYGFSDQTTWSMHPFYKRRLASAYALVRESPTRAHEVGYSKLLPLSQYAGQGKPELIICGAANISDVGATPTGRKAVSFTFTATEVGGPEVGWIETERMEKRLGRRRREDITIESAVAISGAAVSPAMGKMTRPGVTALLALLNARLGVWLPSPRWLSAMDDAESNQIKWVQRPRAQYLFKEMFGRHRQDDLFVYVTDGGHWENLGLVELLRRGCTEIYCFDAAGDKIDSFFTLGEAVALARTELGVEFDIDPEAMEPLPKVPEKKGGDPREHRSKADHTIGRFTYPNRVEGRLLYCKAAITEDAPWDVKAYGERAPAFPAHGTIDQFYSDQRFEAYRALGFHTTRSAVSDPGWREVVHAGGGDAILLHLRELLDEIDRLPPELRNGPLGRLLSIAAAIAARFGLVPGA